MIFPEFKPDQSNSSGVLLVAENVYPAEDGYRVIKDITTVSDSLPAAFQGGVSAIGTDGAAYLLAGTVNALYRLSAGAWTTLASGISAPVRWHFAQLNDSIVCVNGGVTRKVNLATAAASALSGAPTGTCAATIGDHVVIGGAGGDVTKVKWSAFGDETGWTLGTDQCGEQPMQTGGAIQGIAGGEYGIILQRERLVRMTQTTDAETPFIFDEISSNFGCANGSTIAQAGRTIFFCSDRGFMALEDGQALRPIGSEKVDRTFNASVPRDSLDAVFCGVDPENKLVYWGVPGSPGVIWIYNFELDRWATGVFAFEGLMPGFTTSIGLEDLAAIYPNLDTMPYSLDDPRWSGGAPKMYIVRNDHKIGVLTGANLAARIDTGFMELTPGYRARVRKIRPISDAIDGVSIVLNAKARLGDVENLTTQGDMTLSGVVPIRASGRYISLSFRHAAGTVWNYTHGFEPYMEAGGLR